MRLKDLATAINGTIVLSGESNGSGRDNPEITGVSCDSRYIREGEAFFCLTGGSLDGGDFAAEAAEPTGWTPMATWSRFCSAFL